MAAAIRYTGLTAAAEGIGVNFRITPLASPMRPLIATQIGKTREQKKKLLKAKIAVALHDELGRVPKKEEIDNVFLLARVLYKAVLGLHYKRQEQKKNGQLAIF
jgi:hypothetical protein